MAGCIFCGSPYADATFTSCRRCEDEMQAEEIERLQDLTRLFDDDTIARHSLKFGIDGPVENPWNEDIDDGELDAYIRGFGHRVTRTLT